MSATPTPGGRSLPQPSEREEGEPKWLSTYPTSYWQRGCNDGKAGKPRREPGQPGIADMENIGYMNGWHFGRKLAQKQNSGDGNE